MKESRILINFSGLANILVGLPLSYNMLDTGETGFGWEFIFYVYGMLSFLIGLLTLFREDRK